MKEPFEPIVTVLMPVFNSGMYLKAAIDSVLAQSFADFELLLINDGSTDDSESIIQTYNDHRIRAFYNEKNSGLIATLNRGISLARGIYIARMDADDICLPQRLALQVAFLEQHPEISFVATTIKLIDEAGRERGTWDLDQQTTTPQSIRATLPQKNCIAHPTAMGRTEAFRKYGYNAAQLHTEDYDLWLRVLNSGANIGKIKEPQLLYRQHSASVTSAKLKSSFAQKHFYMKWRFLQAEVKAKKATPFMGAVFGAMLLDGATAIFKKLKTSLPA